jgi:hypothetical protein
MLDLIPTDLINMTSKQTKIIDLNFFSGSSESFRTLFNSNFFFNEKGELRDQEPEHPATFTSIEFNRSDSGVVSSDFSFLPLFGCNIRVVGDSEVYENDDFWRYYLIGGSYASKTYQRYFNNFVYFDHYNKLPLPYTSREAARLPTSYNSSLTVTGEYYNYLKRFQDHLTSVESVLQIPNFYLIEEDILARESTLETSQQGVGAYQNEDLENYFNTTYVNSTPEPNKTHRNIISLDSTALLNDYSTRRKSTEDISAKKIDSDIESFKSNMPFGTKIVIEADGTGDKYKDKIVNRQCFVDFMRHLKETFSNENQVPISQNNFGLNIIQAISSGDMGYREGAESTSTISTKIVDFPAFLVDMIQRPSAKTDDFMFLEAADYPILCEQAQDVDGIYSLMQSTRNENLLNDMKDVIDEYFNERVIDIEAGITDVLTSFYDKTLQPKYYEVMAYRVQKIGGTPTGDNQENSVLQNFWFLNKSEAFEYFDSQVKYGTDYTYNIFSYVLIEGFKYRTSDLRTTRMIDEEGYTNVDGTGDLLGTKYCLEFYDPYSGETKEQLYSEANLASSTSTLGMDKFTIIETDIPALQAEIDAEQVAMGNEYSNTYNDINGASSFPSGIKTILLDSYEFIHNRAGTSLGYLNNEEIMPINFIQAAEVIDSYLDPRSAPRATPRPGLTCTDIHGTDSIAVYKCEVNVKLNTVFTHGDFAANSNKVETAYTEILNDLNSIFIPGMEANFNRNEEIKELFVRASELDAEIRSFNTLATNAQIFSLDRYLADFKFDIEPSIKIVEVPLEQKRINIIDNPPNRVLVSPTYVKDSSNKAVFNVKHDVFSYKNLVYPSPISQQDIVNEANYKYSKDLIDSSKIGEKTVSPAEFVQVYMLDNKPETLKDFDGKSISTIDMKAEDGNIYSEKALYVELESNRKYYFAFRFINSNGVSGPLSRIYESELVDDGGYRYTNFSIIDLDEEPDTNQSSTEFKKLFSLVPKASQLSLNIENLDFSDTAKSQISNVVLGDDVEDKIWNKTYKVRLTSKKTQKRLDLNITFKKQEKI